MIHLKNVVQYITRIIKMCCFMLKYSFVNLKHEKPLKKAPVFFIPYDNKENMKMSSLQHWTRTEDDLRLYNMDSRHQLCVHSDLKAHPPQWLKSYISDKALTLALLMVWILQVWSNRNCAKNVCKCISRMGQHDFGGTISLQFF